MYYANNMMDDDRRFQEKIFGKKKIKSFNV